MEYKTRDFYLGACLLAAGVKLLRLERETAKLVTFVFSISPLEAHKLIQQHWDCALVIPTRSVIEAINELKTRMYAI